MTGPALSTMWAQQPRFEGDFVSFSVVARDTGYTGIEVSHSTDRDGLEALLRGSVLPIRSLHAPTPRLTSRSGGSNSGLNLAATDEDHRQEAVEHHLRTIEYAGRAGIPFVIVHLGGMTRMLAEEHRLRRLYETDRIDTDAAREKQAQAHRVRAEAIAPHRQASMRSLAELVEAAARVDVVIGLENRLHLHEIPNAEETAELLAPYPPDRAGYWHDTGHAEVQGRLGLLDPRAALAMLAGRLVGAHLHDVRGIRDHRAPGSGDVDWSYIAASLPPTAARTLEIDQHEPQESLATAISFLRQRGVVVSHDANHPTQQRTNP